MITLTPSNSVANAYSLNWGAQQSHILDGLRNLMGQQDDLLLTDVTLACDGEYIPAHKLVLSLCSPFFKDLFQKNRADKANTIVIISHVNARNLKNLLQFMYQGKVDIPSKDVDSFLQAGNLLKVEGLIGNVGGSQRSEVPSSSQSSRPSTSRPGPASKKPAPKSDTTSAPPKRARLSESGATTDNASGAEASTIATADTAGGGEDDPLGTTVGDDGGGEEGDEEGVDFDNFKTEPIEVYSGFEDENQTEGLDDGNDDTYEESGEDSYQMPPNQPGPSTSSQASRPRSNVPGGNMSLPPGTYQQRDAGRMLPPGKFSQGRAAVYDYFILPKHGPSRLFICKLCQKQISSTSGTSNLLTHMRKNHQEHCKSGSPLAANPTQQMHNTPYSPGASQWPFYDLD